MNGRSRLKSISKNRRASGLGRGARLVAPVVVLAMALLASCSGAPPPGTSIDSDADGTEIVQVAESYIGAPYRNGGQSRNGLDCSGLVVLVYGEFGVNLPRTSRDQSRVGKNVPRHNLEPGDLVFFKTSSRYAVSHVGIYIGDGSFIHASTGARQVRVDQMSSKYFRDRFVVARRVVD